MLEKPDPAAIKAAQEAKQKKKQAALSSSTSSSQPPDPYDREKRSDHGRDLQGIVQERAIYSNVRVLQRTLLYVVGLPSSSANEELLKKKEHFGRFGRIVKIAVNRKPVHNALGGPSYSAYITFKRGIVSVLIFSNRFYF